MLSPSGLMTSVQGQHRPAGGVARGVSPGLGLGDPDRGPIVVTAHQQWRTGGPDCEVRADIVGLWSCLAEGADRRVDQLGKPVAQCFVVQPKIGHRADVGGFDEEVRRFQQAKQKVASPSVFEIAGDAALASGVCGPVDRLVGTVGEERGNGASCRAGGRFDLDHVGAEVGEHLSGEHAALVGEVDDSVGRQHLRQGNASWLLTLLRAAFSGWAGEGLGDLKELLGGSGGVGEVCVLVVDPLSGDSAEVDGRA